MTCKICSKFGWHVNRLTNENTGLQEGSDMERLGRNREARVSSWAIRFIQLQASHGAGATEMLRKLNHLTCLDRKPDRCVPALTPRGPSTNSMIQTIWVGLTQEE